MIFTPIILELTGTETLNTLLQHLLILVYHINFKMYYCLQSKVVSVNIRSSKFNKIIHAVKIFKLIKPCCKVLLCMFLEIREQCCSVVFL